MPVPIELEECVRQAASEGDGARLELLAWEVATFGGDWRDEALRAIDAARACLADRGEARHIILFTGHRVDAPGRRVPRFPAAAEGTARAMIREAVERHVADDSHAVGLAGGASGGDILFHEVCAELSSSQRVSQNGELVNPGRG